MIRFFMLICCVIYFIIGINVWVYSMYLFVYDKDSKERELYINVGLFDIEM